MIEKLEQIDHKLFLALNSYHNPVLDEFMLLVSGKLAWIPLYILFLYLLYKKVNSLKVLGITILFIAVLVALTDLSSVHLFKKVFLRYRPCHNETLKQLLTLVGNCGGKYGFVSSHAANVFGIATFLSLVYSNKKNSIMLFIWACLVAYSRVYLARHYPSDIFCGALLGIFIATFVFQIRKLILKKWQLG